MQNITEFLESTIGLKLIKPQILEKLQNEGYVIVQKYSLNEIWYNLNNSVHDLWEWYNDFVASKAPIKRNYFTIFIIISFSFILLVLIWLCFLVRDINLIIMLWGIMIMVLWFFMIIIPKLKMILLIMRK